ncbi:MAG: 3-deoxy-D-manno-octulosonic acid transferase [Nitrospirae bacterium]|nr:3-deoxy-D-manno-octulosonic acid transferase [Nitrospirota bacterium]
MGKLFPNPPLPVARLRSNGSPTPLIKGGKGGLIHIHAVSVGEVIVAVPFINELKRRHPEMRIVLSTVTPTGNEVAHKRLPEIDHVVYFPFDLPWSVKRFVNRIQPDIYISVETELWPNFLRQVKLSGAKTIIINGRISPSSFKGYSKVRPFMRKVLSNIDLFCMQSEEDARRIREIGVSEKAVRVTGNMKYDQKFVEMGEDAVLNKMRLFGINEGDKVIVAGSTHPGEDEIILISYKECLKDDKKIRLIIVPRHTERAGDIEKLIENAGFKAIRRTELTDSGRDTSLPHTAYPLPPIIVVDTIGELSTLYILATIVIIGGSFVPHGGQNPLEAMYYKKPVIFGEHMFNFQQITEEILSGGAGMMVEKGEDLTRMLKVLLNDSGKPKEMGEKGYRIIIKNRGAVERNLAIVGKFLTTC